MIVPKIDWDIYLNKIPTYQEWCHIDHKIFTYSHEDTSKILTTTLLEGCITERILEVVWNRFIFQTDRMCNRNEHTQITHEGYEVYHDKLKKRKAILYMVKTSLLAENNDNLALALTTIANTHDTNDEWNCSPDTFDSFGTTCRNCGSYSNSIYSNSIYYNTVLEKDILLCSLCIDEMTSNKIKFLACQFCHTQDVEIAGGLINEILEPVTTRNPDTGLKDKLMLCHSCATNMNICSTCLIRQMVSMIPIPTEELDRYDIYHARGSECQECYDTHIRQITEEQRRVIRNYSFKPHARFFKDEEEQEDNLIFHGVELEIAFPYGTKLDRNSVCNNIKDVMNGELYFKEDNSIGIGEIGFVENGVEIVSHPCSLKAHRNIWKKALPLISHTEVARSLTCGLHISFNRTALQPKQIAKLILFINSDRTRENIERMAGRGTCDYSRIQHKDMSDVYNVNSRYLFESHSRYEAVNCQNRSHIEIRIFKATDNYNVLMRSIEFVNALVMYQRKRARKELWDDWEYFSGWVKTNHSEKYPHFIEWLGVNLL